MHRSRQGANLGVPAARPAQPRVQLGREPRRGSRGQTPGGAPCETARRRGLASRVRSVRSGRAPSLPCPVAHRSRPGSCPGRRLVGQRTRSHRKSPPASSVAVDTRQVCHRLLAWTGPCQGQSLRPASALERSSASSTGPAAAGQGGARQLGLELGTPGCRPEAGTGWRRPSRRYARAARRGRRSPRCDLAMTTVGAPRATSRRSRCPLRSSGQTARDTAQRLGRRPRIDRALEGRAAATAPCPRSALPSGRRT